MIVDYSGYTALKKAFFQKHSEADWSVDTSPMDEYGVYYKTYIFSDNAIWYERMAPVYFKQDIVVANTKVVTTVEVKLQEVEFWSTEAGSNKYYEKW